MGENYLKIQEIADKYHVHAKTVLGWITRGELEALKVGRMWRVTEEQLARYLEKNNKK